MKRRLILCLILAVCMLLPVATAVSADTGVTGTVLLVASDIAASSIGYYSATISWKTNDNATSQVFYDTAWHSTTAEYGSNTTEDTALVTEHSIPLTGLSSGTTYHYRVRSAIPDTKFITISEDYTFKTLTPAVDDGVGVGAPTYYLRVNLWGEKVRADITYSGWVEADLQAISVDAMLTLRIKRGVVALTKEGRRLREIEVWQIAELPPPPENRYIIGVAYDFSPEGATFDPSIELEMRYDHSQIADVDEESLVIAYYDEDAGEWVELDCVVDTENNTITASLEHFTTFAIIGTIKPAAFILSSLSISPAEVNIGESVTISAIVANTGGMSGSHMVTLKIDGVVEASEEVTISAGASKKVAFTTTKDVAGSYSVNVDGLSGSFTIMAPPVSVPGEFLVRNLSIRPAEVEPNEIVTITVSVTNTHDIWGIYSLVLKINGVKEAEKQAELDAGSIQEVSFSVTKADLGSYSVFINGLSGRFTVVAPEKPLFRPWIIVIIIIAVVVGLGIFLWLRRRT